MGFVRGQRSSELTRCEAMKTSLTKRHLKLSNAVFLDIFTLSSPHARNIRDSHFFTKKMINYEACVKRKCRKFRFLKFRNQIHTFPW